jgi:hypothetical protein
MNAVEKLKSVLLQQLPAELSISNETGGLLIRDAATDAGKGYRLRVTKEQRYFQAIFEFEDYARQLADYAAAQLNAEQHFLADLAAKYPAFSGRIFRQTSENIFDSASVQQDRWSLAFEYKAGDAEADMLTFSDILLFLLFFLFPYQTIGEEEGAVKDGISSSLERSRFNRALCLAFHGYDCTACGLNMRETYRGLKNDFVHVHHLNPVAAAGITKPDPIRDMVPLCPNCHAVAHLKNPPYTVQEIKQMIKGDG